MVDVIIICRRVEELPNPPFKAIKTKCKVCNSDIWLPTASLSVADKKRIVTLCFRCVSRRLTVPIKELMARLER